MNEANLFLIADRLFYERVARYRFSTEYLLVLRSLVPTEWQLSRNDIWLAATPPGNELPREGFKIHVSTSTGKAIDTLHAVIPVLVAESAAFKIAGDARMLNMLNSKRCSRGSGCKFITIYPTDVRHFRTVIEKVHRATHDFEGPFILSDRRYSDSRVVHYRYGGFVSHVRQRPDGTRVPLVHGADGTEERDERTPYFKLPAGISDPFGTPDNVDPDILTLCGGRFAVFEALSFSNSGGVYRANDRESGEMVVIKEARPHTHSRSDGAAALDAVSLLRREFEVLQRFERHRFFPRPILLFREWEHWFLVQELVPGIPLTRLRARDEYILTAGLYDQQHVARFCTLFRSVGAKLIDIVQAIHSEGALIGDLSPNNVLVDSEDWGTRLVDVESVCNSDEEGLYASFASSWYTPGYRKRLEERSGRLRPADDWFAVGTLLHSLVLPVEGLFELHPPARVRFLRRFEEAGVPGFVRGVIEALWAAEPAAARQLLCDAATDRGPDRSKNTVGHHVRMREPVAPLAPDLTTELPKVLDGIVRSVHRLMDIDRIDRLWPADWTGFLTNPLSVGYGACGTAIFLLRHTGELPTSAREWIQQRFDELIDCPPGLLVGYSGIALSWIAMGDYERAERALVASLRSPLLGENPGFAHGQAGVGIACIHFYRVLGDPRFLKRAEELGYRLLTSCEEHPAGRCWRIEGALQLGLGHGAAGVALFLLRLWEATGERVWKHAAEAALEFEIAHAADDGRTLRWGASLDDRSTSPYWLYGTAGVGMVLVRFHQAFGGVHYLDLARRAAAGVRALFTVVPGHFEGMSGVGSFLLDLYHRTGEVRYHRQAQEVARSILCYRIDTDDGVLFPGRMLMRASLDYGTGSAGIGAFLSRLLSPLGQDPFGVFVGDTEDRDRQLQDRPARRVLDEPAQGATCVTTA